MRRVDYVRKIWGSKQRTDIGNYSFIHRTIKNYNQLPSEALEAFACKPKYLERDLGKKL
jgi:hypothetical protein